jgi:acetylornithine deacetylase/succinyl-diaminopimelate desuccinylase-like protein
LSLVWLSGICFAQTEYPSKLTADLMARPDIQVALNYVDKNFEAQISEWKRLIGIPAPSGREQERAAYMAAEFRKLGLEVSLDEKNNVTARRRGTIPGPAVVLAAHMDTVFPLATDLSVTTRSDGTMHAPGAGDDAAGLANLLQAARALNAAEIRTQTDVVFLATTGEETGFHGAMHWLERNRQETGMFVAHDGGLDRVAYGALGSRWSMMTFAGEAVHTLNSRGKPNSVRAAAECITEIYTIPLPSPDAPVQAYYNVGGIMQSGAVFNAIPSEVAFSVDLRTVDPELLQSLDDAIIAKCRASGCARRPRSRNSSRSRYSHITARIDPS